MLTLLKHAMRLNDAIQAEYQASFDVAAKNSWSNVVATTIEGSGVEEIREFLVEDIKLRDGEGVEYSDLRTHGMTIAHRKVSGGFVVKDRDFKSETAMKLLLSATSGLGAASTLVGQKLLLALLNNPNAKAYDGLPFFGAGHFNNYKDDTQGVYDNTSTGKVLDATNLSAAIAEIESRAMPDGTPRNLKARWLLHPPSLKKDAHTASGAKFIAGTENVIATQTTFGVVPVTIPGLAPLYGDGVWIVAAELPGGKAFERPFGISKLVPPSLTDFSGLTDPQLRRMQELEYLVTGDLAAYLGHPYLAHRCAVGEPPPPEPEE